MFGAVSNFKLVDSFFRPDQGNAVFKSDVNDATHAGHISSPAALEGISRSLRASAALRGVTVAQGSARSARSDSTGHRTSQAHPCAAFSGYGAPRSERLVRKS
jgi:hypothetical protein